jgi:histidyl-tRNA synthetase
LLGDLGVDLVEDPYLVRGLDYYSRTAFELESPHIGAQSSLAGGGRYDLLSQEIGSKLPVPAVGFAAGFERLFLALEAQASPLPETPPIDAFLVALGDAAMRWVFRQAHVLRDAGFRVNYDLKGRSMKAQMRAANRSNARFALIVGKDELEAGKAQVKDMEAGTQEEVAFETLADHLRVQSKESRFLMS